MGAPISDFQKVISQTDQLASTTSADSTSTISANSSSNATSSTTANINTNQTSQAKNHHHHQQHHHHHHYNNHQQRYHYPNIAGQHHQSTSYHHQQQQTIRFPPPPPPQQQHQQLGLPQLVYAAPSSNTALAFDHLQSAALHSSHPSIAAASASLYSNSWQPFAGPSSSLIAHALHHPAANHAAAALYPAAAASYYLPFGPPQPIIYTTPTSQPAQATATAHLQSQYPTLLAAAPVTCNDGSHHYHPHQIQYSSTNVSLQSEQSESAESTSPAPSSASPASSSSSSDATADAPDDTTATPDDDDDDEPMVAKSAARHPSKAASYDSDGAINAGTGAAWMPAAGPQASYQPATYYLTSANSASPTGFLLMSAYPLIPQANYTTEYLIHHPQQHQQLQQYSPLNSAAGYNHHGQFYTHPMLSTSAAQHHLPAPAYMQPPTTTALGQLKAGYNLISMLPIDAQPTQTRQAYGMDKVWQDEFECLFSSFLTNDVAWTLAEVETNPSLRGSSDRIIAYSGRYIIRASGTYDATVPTSRSGGGEICCAGCQLPEVSSPLADKQEQAENSVDCDQDRLVANEVQTTERLDDVVSKPTVSGHSDEAADLKSDSIKSDAENAAADSDRADESEGQTDDEATNEPSGSATPTDKTVQEHGVEPVAAEIESDCDSGAQVNSTGVSSSSSSSGSSSSGSGNHNDESVTSAATGTNSETNSKESLSSHQQQQQQQQPADTRDLVAAGKNESRPSVGVRGAPTQRREFVKRFRMFIDSAKVRFCCDVCGHGWTSMKGRVVFWYELFEVVEQQRQPGKMIGYCAYKLFGQQCDVCKIENRFERPMWYPEEVTKVLNNLYNKIGQVYFGFKMPAIDKQRRAGKPKTSHNSSLCQACHDGVCTDRK